MRADRGGADPDADPAKLSHVGVSLTQRIPPQPPYAERCRAGDVNHPTSDGPSRPGRQRSILVSNLVPDGEANAAHDQPHEREHPRRLRVRRHPYPTWTRQEERRPPRSEAGQPRRRPHRRDAPSPPGPRPERHRRRRPRLRDADRRPGRRHRQGLGDRGRPARHHGRRPAQPVLLERPRGGQPGGPAHSLRLGGPDPRRWRRVDEPGPDGLRRGRLGDGPRDRVRHRLRPAGDRRRPDRHLGRLVAHRCRRVRRGVAGTCGQGRGQRLLHPLGRPGQGPQRHDRPRPRGVHPSRHDGREPGRSQAQLRRHR